MKSWSGGGSEIGKVYCRKVDLMYGMRSAKWGEERHMGASLRHGITSPEFTDMGVWQ